MVTYTYEDAIYTLAELRQLFPHISLPAEPTADDLPTGVTIVPAPAPEPATVLADAKAVALARLAEAFTHAEKFGHFGSSLGYEVDATERANRDVQGLLTLLHGTGQTETFFCDYGNNMRPVTVTQLMTLQLELLAFGQILYARKWELRTRIEAAESAEAIEKIEITFDDLPAPELGAQPEGGK